MSINNKDAAAAEGKVGRQGWEGQNPHQKAPEKARKSPDILLVEEDWLYFRIQALPRCQAVLSASGTETRPASEVLAEKFRHAFGEVWQRIPGKDRERLLAYWETPPTPGLCDEIQSPVHSWPLIQIIDSRWSASAILTEKMAYLLSFPAGLVCQPQLLPREIARALAEATLCATGEYLKLRWSLVLRPLDRWEEKQGEAATEGDYEKKQDELLEEFTRQSDARLTKILRVWGFVQPTCTE